MKLTSLVGASLLAKALCQSMNVWLTLRFREQARSHRALCQLISSIDC